MIGKLLRWFGLLALLAFAGIGAAGLWWVQDHVRLVVQLDAADQPPDPTALLRDELSVIATKQEELRSDLGAHLTKLAQALDEAGTERHQQILAAMAGLPELERRAAGWDCAVAALRAQLDGIQTSLAAQVMPRGDAAGAEPVPDVAASATAAPPAITESAPPPPVLEPAAAAPPPEPAPRRTFLSFELPDRRYRFDAKQRYTLLPALSRVGFDAKSTLHDFSGVTSAVRGAFVANFGDPASLWSGEIGCRAATLITGVEGRDEGLREHLDVQHHPEILFEISRFAPDAQGSDPAHEQLHGQITGNMTIRGKTRELTMPVRIHVDEARRVVVEGEVPLRLTDYGVPVPSQLGLIGMEDEVKIWIALRARATGEVNDAR